MVMTFWWSWIDPRKTAGQPGIQAGVRVDQFLIYTGAIIIAALSCTAAAHALLFKRDSRSALGWMSISLTVPLLGPFLYWCLGINRISRRARIWQKSGRRISGIAIYPLDRESSPVDLPPGAAHLADLRTLADRVVQTRLREGNRIIPLVNGEEAYPAMLEAIGNARRSINLSSYIFEADGIGAVFVDRLEEAARRGVEVRVILDAMGEKYSSLSPRTTLAGSPVRMGRFLPLRHGAYINLRNHRKLLIVDGQEGFTGGMNIRSRHQISRTEVDTAVRDMHFHIQGPVVSDLQRAFLEDWHFVAGERVSDLSLFFPAIEQQGSAMARCISDGPDKEFRKLEQIFLGAISCASRSIFIMTPYFVPDRTMVSALITAALRGVNVQILLPAINNIPIIHWATRGLLDELLANGIRFYYQPAPFVHTKLFLVDDVCTMIGSANLDARSLHLNFELNLSIIDSGFAMQIREHFNTAISASRSITIGELKSRSLPVRLRDNFARLFSPYL